MPTYDIVPRLVALFLEIQVMLDTLFLPLFRMKSDRHIELAPSFLFTHERRHSENCA